MDVPFDHNKITFLGHKSSIDDVITGIITFKVCSRQYQKSVLLLKWAYHKSIYFVL